MIQFENVFKRYPSVGHDALSNISFERMMRLVILVLSLHQVS